MTCKKWLTIATILFTLSPLAFAGSMTAGLKYFKTGSYQDAYNEFSTIKGSDKERAVAQYLSGLSLNRLQRYDQSISHFEKALALKNDSKDLYYELGQAQYANNDLEKARKSFARSYKKAHKSAMSLYYVAHISQILEDHKRAKNYYLKVLKIEKRDKKLRQVARFQLSESLLGLAEKRKNVPKMVDKYVLPQMRKAFRTDTTTPLALDIKNRITELERRYNLDPNFMKNGRVLPAKRWTLSANQSMSYDSNITLSTEETSTQATQADSFIHNTRFNANYMASFFHRWVMTTGLSLTNTIHGERDNTTVYQNDGYGHGASLNNSFEHTAFKQKASLIFNYGYDYSEQDHLAQKDRKFYSYSHTVTLGEKFQLFKWGPTSIKFKWKDYNNHNIDSDSRSKSFIVDQIVMRPNRHIIVFFFQADYVDVFNNTTSSTDSYLFRSDYIISNIWPSYSLNLAMSVILLDTKEQSLTRGTEKTFNPSISLTKKINKNLKVTGSYNYTKNTSLDEDTYAYTKHVTALKLNLAF